MTILQFLHEETDIYKLNEKEHFWKPIKIQTNYLDIGIKRNLL